jgi:hypothetical protein
MFWNIEGIPVKRWNSKTRELNDWMAKHKVDTMLKAEINTFWSRIPAEHQWHERNAGQLGNNKKKHYPTTAATPTSGANNNSEE